MTILETVPIFEYLHTYEWIIWVGSFVAVISFIGIMACTSNDLEIGAIVFCTLFILSFITILIGIINEATEQKVDTGRKQYIVRIDDNYPLNDFYEKYEIIEHTKYTDVYTIEEKENVN